MYDTIVIGAGPAGLTAAIYLRRANKNVLVLEGNSVGGAIINTQNIENYPACPNISGYDFANNLYNQAKELGAIIKFEKVLEICGNSEKTVKTNKKDYKTKTIIIATGTTVRKLGIEDALIGKGVSYCAMCDGAFYKDKQVAVVGGGNTALEDALYLADIAKKVYLIHRRNEFRADDKTIKLLKKKNNIKYVLESNVVKINGNEKLTNIEVMNKDKETKIYNVEGLFIAIGHTPNSELVSQMVKLDNDGYIVASNNCHTSKKGIYAAGDVRSKKVRQLVTSTSDGAIAAIEAINYLNQ